MLTTFGSIEVAQMIASNRTGAAGARRTGAGTIKVPRRWFLQGSAALGGAALLDHFAWPAQAAATFGALRDIGHFIFLMKENRSFDHYFGTLSGVRGV
jgi:Phosphoesterase family